VRFLLSTNLSEIALTAATIGLAPGAPLGPEQLLWLNLITDVAPALALGLERAEADVLREAPRDTQAPIFACEEFGWIAAEGALIGASSLAAHLYGMARFAGPMGGGVGFLAIILAQLLQAWSNRSAGRTVFSSELPLNPQIVLALGGLGALQMLAALLPVSRRILGIGPLDVPTLGVVSVAAAAPFLITESALKGAATLESVT
jgi:Ca2+-transporting ATPase